eukprot:g5444.t1
MDRTTTQKKTTTTTTSSPDNGIRDCENIDMERKQSLTRTNTSNGNGNYDHIQAKKKMKIKAKSETAKEPDELLVAAAGWASPLDARQCNFCKRCGVTSSLLPAHFKSVMCKYDVEADEVARDVVSELEHFEERQRWCGMPDSNATLLSRRVTDWLEIHPSKKMKRNRTPLISDEALAVLLTSWYNRHRLKGANEKEKISEAPEATLRYHTTGALLAFKSPSHEGNIFWVHEDCTAAEKRIRRSDDERWFGVVAESDRLNRLVCSQCGISGASAVCSVKMCPVRVHQTCAQEMRLKAWRQCCPNASTSIRQSQRGAYYTCWFHRQYFDFIAPKQHRILAASMDPVSLVGRVIEKDFFEHGRFLGIVKHYDPCARRYLVQYEDNDEEEMESAEILTFVLDEDSEERARRCTLRWTSLKSIALVDAGCVESALPVQSRRAFEIALSSGIVLAGALVTELERHAHLAAAATGEKSSTQTGVAATSEHLKRLDEIVKRRLEWWSRTGEYLQNLIADAESDAQRADAVER